MRKEQLLQHWGGLEDHTPPGRPLPVQPIRYRHEGTTIGLDGIRISGSPEFIDAVLSRIKDLLEAENTVTRLQVNYQPATEKGSQRTIGGHICYVQVRQRGGQAIQTAQALGLYG